MTPKKPVSRQRKLVKATLITTGILAILIVGFHIWFVNNARHLIKEIVTTKSGGKLKLELSQISFDFFSNKLQIKEAYLVSTDSLTSATSYRVNFRKLTLKSGSLWSLIFDNRLQLDSIKLHDPEVVVTQWHKDSSTKFANNELSISQEMGKLYNSMLDGLDAFGIRRVIVNNAKLTLINKITPVSEPIVISNLYFNLIRTAEDVGKRDEFVKNEQSVDLTTTNQNIALPGGRQKLAFKTFNLQLFNKRIELDSCTVTGIAKDSMKSSYTVFFKKLLLSGVDFDAMYRYNLIKADSVYCEDPLFDININTGAGAISKKENPDPDKIIQELTGDLNLAFVGVKDAGIHINITGKKKRSLFNSNKDDFEMRGLRINADSSKPVVVDRFDMLVRDYHLYNEDSSTAYTFDSIHFLNKKIILNNFSVSTSSSKNKLRSERDFKIPYFELTGLDWYQLVFENNLKAREAVLINPVINYTKRTNAVAHKKTNIFRSLQTFDDLITLNKISVINGQINMNLGKSTLLNIHDANISLYTDRLLESTNNEGLRRAVEKLSFSKGLLQLKDITAQIQNAKYIEGSLVHADKIIVTSRSNQINASVNDVFIDNLLVDESSETMQLDGLRWKSAKITVKPSTNGKTKKASNNFVLKNISGSNTSLSFLSEKNKITTFIQTLKLSSLQKNTDGKMQVEGFLAAGKNLSFNSPSVNLIADSYKLENEQPSYLTGLKLEQVKERDSISVTAPRIDFTADLNAILAKDFHLKNLEATGAVVQINKWNAKSKEVAKTVKPSIRIDRISAIEPDIFFSANRNDSTTVIRLPKSENSNIKAEGLLINDEGIALNTLSVHTTSATFLKPTGEILGVEKGKVDIELSNLKLIEKNGIPAWTALINKLYLKNPASFALGNNKNKLEINEASIGNVNLSSDYISDFNRLLQFNLSASLQTATGQYIDSTTTLKWFNAEYNSTKKTLSLDSFQYHPTQPRDSVMLHSPFQTDYITLNTGAVQLSGFNLDKYEKDSSLIADMMQVKNPVITVYRDKQPPFLTGIYKPLPVDMIRKISLPVSIQKLKLSDGLLSYTEKNAKSRAEGTILLTQLNAELSNIKNRQLQQNDSLLLTMNAYLMDSALVKLTVKESYYDTLSGFLMTLKLNPTTLSFLNPVIVPMSNVKITSGTIDSLHMKAIGRNNLSIGEMQMFYHDLRIKVVKNGEENRSGFLGNIATFLANTFIIKKNNKGRTGIVYFERLQDRSFFNYIVKMVFSGMTTSIGVKKNKKFLKQYKRELKQRNLPPLEFQ
jgi:hypothetical protein